MMPLIIISPSQAHRLLLLLTTIIAVFLAQDGSSQHKNILFVNSWSIQPSSFTRSEKPLFRSTSSLQMTTADNNNNSNNNGNKKPDLATQVTSMGLNELQTQFRLAIAREDMDAAILYRDELAERVDSSNRYNYIDDNNDDGMTEEERLKRKRQRLSWAGLGTAPWLMERLDALEYALPTTIQINAMEAVNAILSDPNDNSVKNIINNNDDNTLEERLLQSTSTIQNMGLLISGSTGSGKTLAYLVPTLSTLSQTLFTRQRIRVKAEEDVGDLMGDLLERVAVQTSPSMKGQGYEQVGGKQSSTSASSTLGKSGTDVKSPIALIVVPTRELGVQIALLLFELVGGNKKQSATERSGKRNMFKYKGPKGVKIGCVLDDEMSKEGLKLQTDIAITTPKYLTKLMEDGDVDPSKLRVVVYDEADLGLEQTSTDNLKLLFDGGGAKKREFSRISYLVGATVTESLGNLAVRDEILPKGKSYIVTATRFAPLAADDVDAATIAGEDEEDVTGGGEYLNAVPTVGISSSADASKATLKDLNLCLDPGLRHERVVAPDNTELLCLTRMLRKELKDFEIANATLTENGSDSDGDEENDLLKQLAALREETKDLEEEFDFSSVTSSSSSRRGTANKINSLMRPKVVVFFPDEDEARDAILSLRDAMWGEHKLGVLLPNTGTAPLSIMESFKKGDISVLLATPNSIRGLDFPELTHVYTLFLPDNDPREYLHLAGRVGRIGQQGSVRGQGGRVTTILDQDEAPKFDQMATFLGFDYEDVAPIKAEISEQSDVEDMRRYLEDTITLLGTVDDIDEKKDTSEND
eukprot:scaffold10633_cov130-Skeletonema_menzelii.AAC.2